MKLTFGILPGLDDHDGMMGHHSGLLHFPWSMSLKIFDSVRKYFTCNNNWNKVTVNINMSCCREYFMEDSRHTLLWLDDTNTALLLLVSKLHSDWLTKVGLGSDWLTQSFRHNSQLLILTYFGYFMINLQHRWNSDTSSQTDNTREASTELETVKKIVEKMSDLGDAGAVLNQIKDIQSRDISVEEKNSLINRVLQST